MGRHTHGWQAWIQTPTRPVGLGGTPAVPDRCRWLRSILAAIAAAVMLAGLPALAQLPPVSKIRPGVAREGTLANATLVNDATRALRKALGARVITATTRIRKFVIQTPVGRPGGRAWREIWLVEAPGAARSFLMTFRENGLQAAIFEIQSMEDQSRR